MAPTEAASPPFMTIVLPALNEERYIERCVRSLLDDPYPRERLELFVVDGGSSDRTVAIAEGLRAEFPFLRVLHNPARLQAPAFNLALRAADPRAEYIMRCDVHAEYPAGFLTRGSRALTKAAQEGAVVATYGDAPKALSPFQAAVAFAQNTPIGVGNAWYRLGGHSRFVEHGKHGVFLRRAVERVGGYDEGFSHNEDSELSLRLIQAGGKVWLDSSLTVYYYPRPTVGALARQYWHYGRGRAMTVLKHRIVPKARQLAPVALIGAEACVVALAPRFPSLLGFFAAYLGALGLAAVYGAAKTRNPAVLLAPVALAVMHHAWGAGFISRILTGAPKRRGVMEPANI